MHIGLQRSIYQAEERLKIILLHYNVALILLALNIWTTHHSNFTVGICTVALRGQMHRTEKCCTSTQNQREVFVGRC